MPVCFPDARYQTQVKRALYITKRAYVLRTKPISCYKSSPIFYKNSPFVAVLVGMRVTKP